MSEQAPSHRASSVTEVPIDLDDGDEAQRSRSSTDSHTLIKGRRWRRTDPALDESLRQALVDALMDARRSVKAGIAEDDERAVALARSRVDDAKVALGERGPKWWLTMTDADIERRVTAAMRALRDRSADWSLARVRSGLRL